MAAGGLFCRSKLPGLLMALEVGLPLFVVRGLPPVLMVDFGLACSSESKSTVKLCGSSACNGWVLKLLDGTLLDRSTCVPRLATPWLWRRSFELFKFIEFARTGGYGSRPCCRLLLA